MRAGRVDHRHLAHAQDEHLGRHQRLVQHFVEPVGHREIQRAGNTVRGDAGGQQVALVQGFRARKVVAVVLQPAAVGLNGHHFAHPVHEQERGQHHAGLDGHGQVEGDSEDKGHQQDQSIAPVAAQQVLELLDLAHVPGHDQQHRRQRRQRHVPHQRCRQQHEKQDENRVQHPGYRAARAGPDVGGGAGNRASRRQAAEQRRSAIGNALRHQFAVRTMAAAGHAVGDHRRQQRLDATEEGDGERRREHLAGPLERDMREVEIRQAGRDIAERRADGRDRQGKSLRRQGADDDGNQEARPQRPEPPQPDDQGNAGNGQPETERIEGIDLREIDLPFAKEIARQLVDLQPQEILDLAGKNAHRNAGGKARDHRLRHIAHQRAEPQQAGGNQHQACQQGAQDQAAVAKLLDHHEHDRDERRRRPADLHP